MVTNKLLLALTLTVLLPTVSFAAPKPVPPISAVKDWMVQESLMLCQGDAIMEGLDSERFCQYEYRRLMVWCNMIRSAGHPFSVCEQKLKERMIQVNRDPRLLQQRYQ